MACLFSIHFCERYCTLSLSCVLLAGCSEKCDMRGNAEAEYQSEGYNLCENCYQSKVQNAEIENSSDYDVDNTVTSSDPNATMGERNALGSAIEYLNVMPFSYSGLIEQLEYEGYSNSEATYAADNCGADWYEQAVLAAKGYLDAMSFSRQGLIEQLEFEGFTHDQAVYGVEQNGYVDSNVNKPENGEMQDSDSELSFSIPEDSGSFSGTSSHLRCKIQ